jgi:hypothetical protein
MTCSLLTWMQFPQFNVLALSAVRDVLFLARCDLPGERIVWVGLVAYKMDSSRHTLQRLPGIEIHIALSRMLIDLC